jgi:hypothetical protein
MLSIFRVIVHVFGVGLHIYSFQYTRIRKATVRFSVSAHIRATDFPDFSFLEFLVNSAMYDDLCSCRTKRE